MSPAHEILTGKRRGESTRRELLEAGAAGLVGLGVIAALPVDAAAAVSRTAGNSADDSPGKRLERARPADVGMSQSRLDRVVDCLQAETGSGHVTSASICVARHGRIVLHRGFGRLSEHPDAPPTEPDTIYILASISKPIAVCGVMLLVERGDVVLSHRVQRYLPEFDGEHKEKARVWHLLSHCSGLPDQLPENRELRRSHAPLSQFVTGALKTPLVYEPGTGFGYQSMGTLLAGEIVERVTGQRLRNFLRDEIFEPLGMRRTTLGLGELSVEQTAIYQTGPETEDLRSWGPNTRYWRDIGHPWGGMHSTTGDLAILLQAFLDGGAYGSTRLFSPTTVAAMTRDHNGEIGAPWGLGWALRDSRVWNYFGDLGTVRTFGHVGATGTVAWADPERHLLCALLTTRSAGDRDGFLLHRISSMVQAAVVSL
ncbi:MAG: beta-lactamase family protein [Acidobacteria bacterium]|nr:beta-lactamase family protein [Acidobacteriota bacterium]